MSEFAVVHLVRRVNGQAPLTRFLQSYREHPAGLDHDLVLLMKGFKSEAEEASYSRLAADVSSESISVSDDGYDLAAYLFAGRRLPHERLCFINSFSSILVDGWLELLANAHASTGVGLVGATGSWGSQLSHIQFALGLGGAYSRVYGDRVETRRRLRELEEEARGPQSPGAMLIRKLQIAPAIVRRCVSFEAFPAHHIRTNGFMLSGEILRRIQSGRQRDKVDAFRLEGGRSSVTRQIQAMGLSAVVVGRDGSVYGQSGWDQSKTFWQGTQQNLMIADNQTTVYQNADERLRTILAQFAWGPAAQPQI